MARLPPRSRGITNCCWSFQANCQSADNDIVAERTVVLISDGGAVAGPSRLQRRGSPAPPPSLPRKFGVRAAGVQPIIAKASVRANVWVHINPMRRLSHPGLIVGETVPTVIIIPSPVIVVEIVRVSELPSRLILGPAVPRAAVLAHPPPRCGLFSVGGGLLGVLGGAEARLVLHHAK